MPVMAQLNKKKTSGEKLTSVVLSPKIYNILNTQAVNNFLPKSGVHTTQALEFGKVER